MFQYFKLTKADRTKTAEEPKSRRVWIIHAISELVGTIMLSMMLAGLSIAVKGVSPHHVIALEHYLLHPVIIGFYAGFIAVGAVLFIFLRWSCDLNPAVTITRMIKGTNTYKYGFWKMGWQFVGGIIAGLLIYAFGSLGSSTNQDGSHIYNHAIDAMGASKKSFMEILGHGKSIGAGGAWIFFIEMVMTAVLLFPIFSPMISDKYRDVAIMFVISLAVFMGILGGSAAINPARGLAQQVPGLFWGFESGAANSTNSLVVATVTMMLGGCVAPFFYVTIQGVNEKYFNPLVTKVIGYKNNRKNDMTTR